MSSNQTIEERFSSYVKDEHLFHKKHKLILAFSAGVDSVVLFDLLKNGGYNFEVRIAIFSSELRNQMRMKDLLKHSA